MRGKKFILILDKLRALHSKIMGAWVAERINQIQIFTCRASARS
jgi:hypothetical protein